MPVHAQRALIADPHVEGPSPRACAPETLGPGTARIFAYAGSLSGSTVLTITAFTPEEWAIGEELYRGPIVQPFDSTPPIALPDELSCRTCHGGGPQALSIEFTPTQTGGYSDEELASIVTMGMKPPIPGWRSGIPQIIFTQVHTLPTTSELNQRGLVAFLRSFTPIAQGERDFQQ